MRFREYAQYAALCGPLIQMIAEVKKLQDLHAKYMKEPRSDRQMMSEARHVAAMISEAKKKVLTELGEIYGLKLNTTKKS